MAPPAFKSGILKHGERKTDRQNLLQLLEKSDFKPTIPMQSQLASHLRQVITQARIPADTQLPPIRAMAEMWGTNYHTLHLVLSSLAGEGLVALRPVRGSFIAAPRRALRRACFYYQHEFDDVPKWGEFYSILNLTLYSLLSRRSVGIIPFFDHRPFSRLHTVPPGLRKMVIAGEIDAVIATDIYPENTGWLLKLEVPVVSLMIERPERTIEADFSDMVSKVIGLARKENRQTIGLIHWPVFVLPEAHGKDVLLDRLKAAGAPHGISIISPEIGPEERSKLHPDQEGALLCGHLFRSGPAPDMIFVYPDSLMRGVAAGLREHGVRVPAQVLVVSHRNAESDIYIPFPMTWLTVKIHDFALKLIEQIDRQISGDELFASTVPIRVERTAPSDIDPVVTCP